MRVIFLALALLSGFGCSTIVRTTLPFNDLPAPGGPFTVGMGIETWTDTSRPETFTVNPNDSRRIVVQYWYPAEDPDQGDNQGKGRTQTINQSNAYPYIDHPDKRLSAFAKTMGLPRFLVEHIRDVKTHSLLNQPIHPGVNALPLIVFSHGLGGMKSQNSIQAEELASQGYVVIGADHAFDAYLTIFDDGSTADYRSSSTDISNEAEFWAARGPQLQARTRDIRFILDVIQSHSKEAQDSVATSTRSLWQRIDPDRIGVFGHSFGGATSLMALSQDPRIRAAIALDGWMVPVPEATIDAGTDKPVLYLGQERWDEPLNYEKLDRFITNSAGQAKKEIWPATKHMDFADAPHLSNFARRIGFAGSLSSAELRGRLNGSILTFFAEHLAKHTPNVEVVTTEQSKMKTVIYP
jgi:dienelactone hydrolase